MSAFHLALRPDASPRPAYDEAARTILGSLEDRDGVAVLPLWGQRGPLEHYLTRGEETRFVDRPDGLSWQIDGKRVFIEAIEESMPFETSARNGHFDRLWVAVVDERMFGRAKFSSEVAEQALAWADVHMIPDGRWSFEALELRRYVRAPGLWGGEPMTITSPTVAPASTRWSEPNQPPCTDQGLDEGDPPRWSLNLRVPTDQAPRVQVTGGRLREHMDPAAWSATLEGGPCDGPAPRVVLVR